MQWKGAESLYLCLIPIRGSQSGQIHHWVLMNTTLAADKRAEN
jgi:hypothetical protein